jgi:hypothetical protein
VREEQHDLVQAAKPQPLYGGLLAGRQRRLEAQPVWPLEHTQGDSHNRRISLKHTSTSVDANLRNNNSNNNVGEWLALFPPRISLLQMYH